MIYYLFSKRLLLISLCILLLNGCSTSQFTSDNPDDPTSQAVTHCNAWHAANSWNIGDAERPSLVKVIEQGFCIDGPVNANTHKEIASGLEVWEKSRPLIIVIRSTGGDVDAALDIADTIEDYNTTIVASQFCASSCANYILPAGKKRYVQRDTLLMFHGGVTFDSLNEVARQLQAISEIDQRIDPLVELESIRKDLNKKIDRQERFLEKVGIDRHFFRWMDLFNHMDDHRKRLLCPPNPSMAVYHPKLLQKFGYKIDSYSGPLSQQQTDRLAENFGMRGQVCFWESDADLSGIL